MKKVLYITNIPVPYRVRFLGELAKYCDLTVLFERRRGGNRDALWSGSEEIRFRGKFLRGLPLGAENAFSFGILKEIFSGYDAVIFGCCNSPVQLMAMLALRIIGHPYLLNMDGEPFLGKAGWKAKLKRFFLSGAEKYLVAGKRAGESLRKIAGGKPVIPYYFSALSEEDVRVNAAVEADRGETIAVVGRFYPYKGMDVALEAAKLAPELKFCFVGMGDRAEIFCREHTVPENVEIIPFLQKEEMQRLYASCRMLVLPSRQECWGLVIGEAASFGTPIVSTWGSGAAAEYLGERYPHYLARPGDARSLLDCIRRLREAEDTDPYRTFLLETAGQYTIEESVRAHLRALEGEI